MRTTVLAVVAATLLISGCSKGEEEEQQANSLENEIVEDADSTLENDVKAEADEVVSGNAQVPAGAASVIPTAAQGRWGLVAADCEPGRADAKGLLEISPRQLTFYESRGTLSQVKEREATRVRATFDFTGEGQTWQRDMVLDVQDGGKTLIRRDFGDESMPGPLKYTRCAG